MLANKNTNLFFRLSNNTMVRTTNDMDEKFLPIKSDDNSMETRQTTTTMTTQSGRIPGKKEAKWMQAFSKPPKQLKNKTQSITIIDNATTLSSLTIRNDTDHEETLTVMPLEDIVDKTKSHDPNAIVRREPIVNRSLIGIGSSREDIYEADLAATASSTLDGSYFV